jgi:Family of unknown function (DUF6029)
MKKIFFLACMFVSAISFAQENDNKFSAGELHGNFQFDAQNYIEDSIIGAQKIDEKIRMNSFANLNYIRGKFKAGLRYESYLGPLVGFDSRYNGSGITYRYASYEIDNLEFTVGNFYEQFGTGLIFRSYEERGLGVDNAMDGVRIRYQPKKGIYLKGVIGQQRFFFSKGEGIVRGFDAELNLNELFPALAGKSATYIVGGSIVSKYQEDQNPLKILPENVASSAARLNIITPKMNFYAEYAYKINDPSFTNQYIYKPGSALFASATYADKGLSILASAKFVDNMDFKSNRDATGNVLLINYLPAITKQYTYAFASFYPYATQPNGEFGYQAEISYNFKKGTALGGKYGTLVSLAYSHVSSLDTSKTGDDFGYDVNNIAPGKVLMYEDWELVITKKIDAKWKLTYTYMYQIFNKDVVQGLSGFGTLYSHINILETQYKINKKNTIRTELQHLYNKKDEGSWAMALAEYTVSPHWFFALIDQYNYENPKNSLKEVHYVSASLGYIQNATRIALSYGKQREGFLCVGGVCRQIPASNGFGVSITSTF